MKNNIKKIAIILLGVVLIYGVIYWHVFNSKKRASEYTNRTTSFLISEEIKSDYRERMEHIADVYSSTVNRMEEIMVEENQKIIKEARKILIEEEHITEEEEIKMTDEEIIILLEKVLTKTNNETEKE